MAVPALTWLALSFALGLTIGDHWPRSVLWPGLAIGLIAAGAVVVRPRFNRRLSLILLMLAGLAFGATWIVVRHHRLAANDLATIAGDEAQLIRLRGTAISRPERHDRTRGSMALFDYRGASMSFPLRVEAVIDRAGTETPVRGRVLVRVAETIPPLRAGDRVDVQGFLIGPSPPDNPGEFDYARLARGRGEAGVLQTPRRELVRVTPIRRKGPLTGFTRWRDDVRRRAAAWLLSDLPDENDSARDALLASLLLGQRELHWDDLSASFRRVGLAHLLAISGLHLGVLAGFVVLLMRMVGATPRWHGVAAIVVVLVYLTLVEVRLPVARAGVMTIAASLALVLGRQVRVQGLIALSAIALLLWRPEQLREPGFQLSFGVVLGIVHFSRELRVRWFKLPDATTASVTHMMLDWTKTTFAVTTTAWLVALPITVFHFGVITPVAIPLSMVALPLVAILLALGFLKIVLALILPSAAYLLGVPLSVGAETLLALIESIDGLPGSSMPVPAPSIVWTVCALAMVLAYLGVGSRRRRRWIWLGSVGLVIWLGWPLGPGRQVDPLRLDMLSVGDGTCMVIRSDGQAALFDAGSSTDLNAGRRIIVPALRELGVRNLDFIAISHANLDHYAAVLEITEEFDVAEVLVTPHFLIDAQRDDQEAATYLLDELTRRFVRVTVVSAGERRALGDASLAWLHPDASDRFNRANDTSMVIRVDAAGRVALLTGDIQLEAIASLLGSDPISAAALRADILELPHHGSYIEASRALVNVVDPEVVIQSTGRRRWEGDRWTADLAGCERLVTARDGACVVVVDEQGGIRIERYHALEP